MGRRRVLEVELDGYGSLVRGPGSRELVIEVTGRPPVWSSIRRGWSVQEKTARDTVAAAEVRNYDIVITGPRATGATRVAPVTEATPAPQDPAGGLW